LETGVSLFFSSKGTKRCIRGLRGDSFGEGEGLSSQSSSSTEKNLDSANGIGSGLHCVSKSLIGCELSNSDDFFVEKKLKFLELVLFAVGVANFIFLLRLTRLFFGEKMSGIWNCSLLVLDAESGRVSDGTSKLMCALYWFHSLWNKSKV